MPEHKGWLLYAENDLIAAQRLIEDENHPLIQASLYHSQQATEKALKVYLFFKTKPIPRTHNLEHLIRECIGLDHSFQMVLPHAMFLNPFSISTRYPDSAFMMPYLPTAIEALEQATYILNFVKEKCY